MSGAPDAIALIPAGGIDGPAGVRALLGAGAAPVRLDTAFAVTEEGDAHRAFRAVLAAAMTATCTPGCSSAVRADRPSARGSGRSQTCCVRC